MSLGPAHGPPMARRALYFRRNALRDFVPTAASSTAMAAIQEHPAAGEPSMCNFGGGASLPRSSALCLADTEITARPHRALRQTPLGSGHWLLLPRRPKPLSLPSSHQSLAHDSDTSSSGWRCLFCERADAEPPFSRLVARSTGPTPTARRRTLAPQARAAACLPSRVPSVLQRLQACTNLGKRLFGNSGPHKSLYATCRCTVQSVSH